MPATNARPSDCLQRLLATIAAAPRRPRTEEVVLARAARAGDTEAAARLVEANLQNVVHVARSLARNGLPMEDLIQEGCLGLMRAVRHFDPERGVRFFTYGTFHVRRAMVEALCRGVRTVRISRHAVARRRRGRAGGAAEEPAPYEVSLSAGHPRPGEILPGAGPSPPPAPDVVVAEREERRALRLALDRLPERDRTVLAARFGLDGGRPATLRDVGRRLHVSKERARQLEARALQRVREGLPGPAAAAACARPARPARPASGEA